jgi:hypothetical protein
MVLASLAGWINISQMAVAQSQSNSAAGNSSATPWPTRGWIKDRARGILKDEAKDRDLMNRILPAVRAQACPASH